MAGDLIPPPSPAGRPAPDPEQPPPILTEPPAEPPGPTAVPGPPGPSPFRWRFGFVGGVLAGCGLAAAVLLVVLLSGGSDTRPARGGGEKGPEWSPWKPHTSSTLAGAQEIAKEIEGRYKNANAKQLAKVAGGPISFGVVPATIALPTAERNRYQPVAGVGLQYTLAGFGKDGRLTDGEPSAARHRLLRREALELSLYSFRYLPEVTMVIALLPPAPKAEQFHAKPKGAAVRKTAKQAKADAYQPQALFYRENELRKQLARPLATTMATTPPKFGGPGGEEAERIDGLTYSNLYVWHRIFQQDGRVYLVLDRPS